MWASRAPVLMVSVARLNFAQTGKPNRHAIHDVGLATAQMIHQAMAMGLFVHAMAGFHPDKVCDRISDAVNRERARADRS